MKQLLVIAVIISAISGLPVSASDIAPPCDSSATVIKMIDIQRGFFGRTTGTFLHNQIPSEYNNFAFDAAGLCVVKIKKLSVLTTDTDSRYDFPLRKAKNFEMYQNERTLHGDSLASNTFMVQKFNTRRGVELQELYQE